ncbi:MAG: carbohydrate ABC transporter permease [Oscillospiraceae bacterium]|nr:carbohydrate ABC transporter permease [Oscillospiraceae bacterium]
MANYSGTVKTVKGGYHARILLVKVIVYIVCILLTIMAIAPFVIMIFNASKSRFEIQQGFLEWTDKITNKTLISLLPSKSFIQNGRYLLTSDALGLPFGRGFLNSALIAFGATILSVYFSALTAYGFAVYRFKLNKLLYGFIMLIQMVPTQVTVISFVEMMNKWGLTNSYIPFILPAIAAPGTVFFLRQYMSSALSLEMVEAGRIDGCSEFGIFNRLVLPILKPGMATMAIFAVVTNWNSYLLPTLLLDKLEMSTVPMLVDKLKGNKYSVEYGAVYWGLSLTAAPLIVFYLALSKYIIAGVALGGVKE